MPLCTLSPQVKKEVTMPLLNVIDDGPGVPIESLLGRCVAVLGVRGSGKTNTATVLIEELLGRGIPLTIVDIEDEYWGLLELYDVVVVGYTEHCHVAASPRQAPALARMSIEKGVPVILSFLEHPKDEMFAFLHNYLREIWRAEAKLRRPYFVVLEEAHEFVPLHGTTRATETVERMSLRGRKRGISMILVSQRSAAVRKNVLTQADAYFLHRVTHPTDTSVYKAIVSRPAAEVQRFLDGGRVGQAMMLLDGSWSVVQVREQRCYHSGYTPSLNWVDPGLELRNASALVEAARSAIGGEREDVDPREALVQSLSGEFKQALGANERLQAENAKLRAELARASRLRLEFPPDLTLQVGRMIVCSHAQGTAFDFKPMNKNGRKRSKQTPDAQMGMFEEDDDA